jgi:hypothetical protein
MQPPGAEYLNTAGILRGIKIYLLPASLRPFPTAYKHARFLVPKAAQVLIYKRVSQGNVNCFGIAEADCDRRRLKCILQIESSKAIVAYELLV